MSLMICNLHHSAIHSSMHAVALSWGRWGMSNGTKGRNTCRHLKVGCSLMLRTEKQAFKHFQMPVTTALQSIKVMIPSILCKFTNFQEFPSNHGYMWCHNTCQLSSIILLCSILVSTQVIKFLPFYPVIAVILVPPVPWLDIHCQLSHLLPQTSSPSFFCIWLLASCPWPQLPWLHVPLWFYFVLFWALILEYKRLYCCPPLVSE